jgi:aminopeptidase
MHVWPEQKNGEKFMKDPRVEKLARILVNYSIKVQPREWVLVIANLEALPLTREVARHIIQAGANPTILIEDDDLSSMILAESSDEQLDWLSPVEKMAYEKVDAFISLRAASNTHAMSGIDPQKQRRRQQSRREVMQTYFQRSAEGSLRWTLTQFPCQAYAQDADMSLADYENFVYGATFSDQADPVQAWQNVYDSQQRLVEWLKGKKTVAVRGPHCDLTLSIAGRNFINCAGEKNMPDGEIFTGPVEESIDGWVKFTYPAILRGREVEGVELELKDGRVIAARAQKNEEFLLTMLDSDSGARYVGEFAIGSNYGIQRFTKSILFDEKIGGSFHMALGAGYPETGSRNQSSIHWDMICDLRQDSEIRVDGELFYQNGNFKI